MTYEDNGTRRSGSIYRRYEKQSTWALKRIRLEGAFMLFKMAVMTAALVGVVTYDGLTGLIVSLAVGAVIGAVFGGIYVAVNTHMSRNSYGYKIEITQGYTDELIEELRKYEKITPVSAASVALVYNYRGEFKEALEALKRVDAFSLHNNPNGAHSYFAALLEACLLGGDIESAKAAYENGFYYMKTYMNSPVYGVNVSLSLAIYEYFMGRHDLSLNLLDNGFRILNADYDPEQHIPDENLRSILSCWRAKNLIAVGDRKSAAEMLANCENYYKTYYYKGKIEELKKELSENEAIS